MRTENMTEVELLKQMASELTNRLHGAANEDKVMRVAIVGMKNALVRSENEEYTLETRFEELQHAVRHAIDYVEIITGELK